jgi:hypothetical protein
MLTTEKLNSELASLTHQEQETFSDLMAVRGAIQLCNSLLAASGNADIEAAKAAKVEAKRKAREEAKAKRLAAASQKAPKQK